MSSIKEDIKSQFKCGLSTCKYDHFLVEPVLLPCGDNCCLKCVDELKEDQMECFHCKVIHKKDDLKIKIPNQAMKQIMKNYLKDLNEELICKARTTLQTLKGMNWKTTALVS